MAEGDPGSPLMRRRETTPLRIVNNRYVDHKCPACLLTRQNRRHMKFLADYGEQGPQSCTVCGDGDRLDGKQVTPPRGQQLVCDDEGRCSLLPNSVHRSVRRFFGLAQGTRKRRGAKKRRGSKKRHGTKKRHGSRKKHGSKKRGRSRKHHRGGNGCSARKEKKVGGHVWWK